jgi:hypothetical protein
MRTSWISGESGSLGGRSAGEIWRAVGEMAWRRGGRSERWVRALWLCVGAGVFFYLGNEGSRTHGAASPLLLSPKTKACEWSL